MHLVLPPALLPEVQSDAVGLLFGGNKVHIEGDKELASASYCGAPRWHEQGGAKVRGPIRELQLDRERN